MSSDVSASFIPYRGKLVFTLNLISVTFFLFLMSLAVGRGIALPSENPMLGPRINILVILGAVQGDLVRRGEYWRLFWGHYLHMGFLHWITNSILWYILGVLIEPDYGFFRSFGVFTVCAMTGNMLSISVDPYKLTLGASGGILGFLGACIPYHIEYWDCMCRPWISLLGVLAGIVGVLLSGLSPIVDNLAHIGGIVSGILMGFATLSRNGYKASYLHKEDCREKNHLPHHKQTIDMEKGQKTNMLNDPAAHTLLIKIGEETDSIACENTHPIKLVYDDTTDMNVNLQKRSTNSMANTSQSTRNKTSPTGIWSKKKGQHPTRLTLRDRDVSIPSSQSCDLGLWVMRSVGLTLQITLTSICFYYIFLCPTCDPLPM